MSSAKLSLARITSAGGRGARGIRRSPWLSFRTHYQLAAYGQVFQLNLSADAAFIAAQYTTVHVGAPREQVTPDLRHCFYRGHVNAQEAHMAVFSICGGLVAAIYKDSSIGNLINIVIVKLIVIHNEQVWYLK
ncbi:A disintegrin and metalloproteinase with thrombospondin motifs 20 [Anas platyrhynchos]|uniref:A disintegrin and metalloproteinase with thrombospondin motifs 20 n=1 Tax=Anas platyrhynchos TaxID=8839 RepID=R0KDG7_ANAPL|nr:A disintegrin and metalloproteinase with thrombospondin motifs 20 [Anas platyrhynchos]